MEIEIIRSLPGDITTLRAMFLHENNFQFICDKCHYYGWCDDYLITMNGTTMGYASVWGTDRREDRDTVFEFFLLPPYRQLPHLSFRKLLAVTGAVKIESQSNDVLLTSMLYEFSGSIVAEAILFEDDVTTRLEVPGVLSRARKEEDGLEDNDISHVLEWNGVIVASGGLILNYNFPYADIFMEVKESFRGNGLGSLMVQELKKEAYRTGRVPAARCNISNFVSKATLLRAGFKVCGYRLKGNVKNN